LGIGGKGGGTGGGGIEKFLSPLPSFPEVMVVDNSIDFLIFFSY
jgi:hypothetical protein